MCLSSNGFDLTHIYFTCRSLLKTHAQICPVSLVGQWIEEARSKLSDPGLVYPYHGQGRLRNPDILSKNSIVVTTYNVVASDAFYHSAKGGTNYCPPLEMIRWWRVIADEGHCLKESQTNIWKSCSQIVSDHKWIVTGTPLSTKVFDVKNQLAFLGIEYVNKMMQLCGTTGSGGRNYASNTVIPEHIMYLLKPIVLRHAQNQKYSGTETTLMSLPPKKERTHYIDFDDEYVKYLYCMYCTCVFVSYVSEIKTLTSLILFFPSLVH
jgi:SWI/SNF-related matrix-associated actin-dependent regulator of chromatin subfamily A3